MAFQPLGKQKSSDDALSNPLESKKSSDDALSNPLESKKSSDDGFPTPWKAKNHRTTHFPTPWKAKIIVRRYSNFLESKIIGRCTFRGLGKQKSVDDDVSEASFLKKPFATTFPRPRFLKNLLRQCFRGLVS